MTYRQQLPKLAFDSHGVVTTAAAVAAGVPAVEVRKLAGRGALSQRGHGVYRMLEVPDGALDEYAEAWRSLGRARCWPTRRCSPPMGWRR